MANPKDKREGWLRELSVGDEVAVENGRYGVPNWYFAKVSKITPSGRMELDDKYTYDPRGYKISDDKYHLNRMEPLTLELRAKVRLLKAQRKIKALLSEFDMAKIDAASFEELNDLYKVLAPWLKTK